MKRGRILCGLLVLGGMLANLSAAWSGQQSQDAASSESVRRDDRPFGHGTLPGSRDDELVNDLLTILNETRSSDTFLVTINILQEIKAEARQVIPAIIRNAERLNLFAHTEPDRPSEEQKIIVECIAELMKKEPASDHQEGGPLAGGASVGRATGESGNAAPVVDDPLIAPPSSEKREPLRREDLAEVVPAYLNGQSLGAAKSNESAVSPGRVKPRIVAAP